MVINLKVGKNYLERTDTLKRYYEDIRKYKVLSQEEELGLIDIIKNSKDPKAVLKARNTLIECNQRFVVAVAKLYATNETIMDLISEGNLGLEQALKDYDPTKGTKFASWAVWYIRRAIVSYNVSGKDIVRKTNSSKTYHIVSKAVNAFVQKEYRTPSLDELAEILENDYGVKINNLSDIIDSRVISIDESIDSDDDATVGDMAEFNSYSSSSNGVELSIKDDYNSKLVNLLLSKINGKEAERDKTIIKMSYGIGYDRTYENQEIAEKLGYTTERVRQIKASILAKMREEYEEASHSI